MAQANRAVVAGGAACKSTTDPGLDPGRRRDHVRERGVARCRSRSAGRTTPLPQLASGLGKIAGLLVTAFALTLGAPFWFDLLGKVSRLRGSGPPAAGSAPPPPVVEIAPADASAADK